jgi:hypothetical protein
MKFLILILLFSKSVSAYDFKKIIFPEKDYQDEEGRTIKAGAFGDAILAPNGDVWSEIILADNGDYRDFYNCVRKNENCVRDNSGILIGSKDNEVINSEAIDYCKSIGGNLPSKYDYDALFLYFPNFEDFYKVFYVNGGISLSTRTIHPYLTDHMYFVELVPSYYSFNWTATYRTYFQSISCIGKLK